MAFQIKGSIIKIRIRSIVILGGDFVHRNLCQELSLNDNTSNASVPVAVVLN